MSEEEDKLSQVQSRVAEAVEIEANVRRNVDMLQQQVVQAHDEKATIV
jgi:hypothetical protein